MTTGILILKGKNKSLCAKFTNKNGKQVEMAIAERELSTSLKQKKQNNINQLEGLEVNFEEVAGKPEKVTEIGENFESTNSVPKGDFHNPYNFVSAFPRPEHIFNNSDLGDAGNNKEKIASHGKYHLNLWSGKIKIKLTTKTPLLIPDAATAEEDNENSGHKYYDIRRTSRDRNKPHLPPTEIKGALRTAYEIVTNSRYSVFVEHQDRLAYRINAKGVDLVPARVVAKDDELYLRLMEGKGLKIAKKKQDLLGYAAKLPRYHQGVEASNEKQRDERKKENPSLFPLKYKDNSLPQYGDRVWVRFNDFGEDKIKKSVVTRIRKYITDSPPSEKGNWYKGWVLVSNENILGKKYERVFIEQQSNRTIKITPEITALWTELIKDYQKIHEKDLKQRDEREEAYDQYINGEPGKTAWSRHIYEPGAEQLTEGTLCYVQFDKKKITALFPVVLSRRLYELSPEKLLAANLHPATKLEELSPAERVFGWVKTNPGKGEKAAYKGNLRIGSVQCKSDNAIKEFGNDGFPLSILGQPQPQQARFYVANDKQGKPLKTTQNNNRTQKPGYDNKNQGLRGRKVYPHHRSLPDGHWELSQQPPTANNGHFKEWHRPGREEESRDNQNRSIKAWVKPDTTFEFDIDVINLSNVELGALLWLLDLPDEHYHRLGGGKPFGFGSVRLEIDWENTDLKIGSDWKEYYSSLLRWTDTNSSPTQAQSTITEYQQAIIKAYSNNRPFEQVDFIKAFCIAAKGFEDNLPIHYPRTGDRNNQPIPPHPEGQGFEWFVNNDRRDHPRSLPSLSNETGLPY